MADEFSTVGPIQLKSESTIRAAVVDVKDDKTPTNFLVLGYVADKPNGIELLAKGSGGLEELKKSLSPTFLGYGFYKVISGDQESKRPKFISISFCGDQAPLVKKGKMGVHVGTIQQIFVYSHLTIQATKVEELVEADILAKVKAVGGVNYDGQRDFEKALQNRPTSSSLVNKNILPDPKVPVKFVEQAKKLEKEVVTLKLESALENRPDKNKLEGQNIIHSGSPEQQASADALKLKLAQNSLKTALANRPDADTVAEKTKSPREGEGQ